VETLPEPVQQLVREGRIAAHLAMRYLVPVARMNVDHCRRMAHAFAQHPWTSREAGERYQACRRASGTVRERTLSVPKFRKTQEPANTLDQQLNQISAIAQRALQHLEDAPPANRSGAQRKIARAIELLTELQQRIEETATNHVESGTTSDDSRTACTGSGETRGRAAARDLASKRPEGAEGELERPARDRTSRESNPFRPTDPRVAACVQR
jgi:hypothetical protein